MKKTHLDDAPRVVVFAGPNGAGKSTHADDILKAMGIPTFVNADYIARGLAGTNTEAVNMAAGRIMLRRLSELAAAREDFAFESTLSSRSFAPFLQRLKAAGYRIAIYYFSLFLNIPNKPPLSFSSSIGSANGSGSSGISGTSSGSMPLYSDLSDFANLSRASPALIMFAETS